MEKNEGKGKHKVCLQQHSPVWMHSQHCNMLAYTTMMQKHDKTNREGWLGSMRATRVTFAFYSNLF